MSPSLSFHLPSFPSTQAKHTLYFLPLPLPLPLLPHPQSQTLMNPKPLCSSFFFFFLLFLFLFFILEVSSTSARPMGVKKQIMEAGLKLDDDTTTTTTTNNNNNNNDNNDSLDKLMGVEGCEEGDEECLKRRLLSEAHLDYIYTQHQNP